MSKTTELLKNTIIIFMGRFSTQFISFILLSLYTYCLSTEEYGIIDLIQTYIALLVPIISLRIDTVFFRFILENRNNTQNTTKIITNGIYLLLILSAFFTLIYITMVQFVEVPYVILIYINIIVLIFSNSFLQIARGLGDNISYSVACIIVAVFNIFFSFLFFYVFKFKGATILISTILSNCACCMYLIYRCKILKFFKYREKNRKKIFEMLKYSLPMIPDGLSWWIVSASDRIIINYFLGASCNGIYAVSSKFSNILSSIFTVVNMSWQESASIYIDDEKKDEFFSKIFNNIMKITISICLLLMAGMFILFEICIDVSYGEAYKYIPILLIANIFNALSVLQGGILIAKMDTKTVAKSTVIGALTNILLNSLLIKRFGIFAASISTVVAYITITIIRNFKIKQYTVIKIEIKDFIYLIIALLITVIMFYINNIILNICYLIIIIIFISIFNKSLIFNFFKILKEKRKKVGRKI